MKSAFGKDILRSITKSKKRFCAIMVITALGVMVLTGIKAACIDMRKTADLFFDEQNLFDIQVLSTLGLTEDDVRALKDIPEVESAEGGFGITVTTRIDGVMQNIYLSSLSDKGKNMPYVLEGKLPEKAGEVAVTSKYITSSGSKIGDVVSVKEEVEKGEEAALKNNKFIITGIVLDPMEVSGEGSTTAFRANGMEENRFFILSDDVDSEVYTVIYLSLKDTNDLICYSKAYEEAVQETADTIETKIRKQRQDVRYQEVYGEAEEKIADAKEELNREFAKADIEFGDASSEIAENEIELMDGKEELAKGEKELKEKEQEAAKEIADAKAELEEGKQRLQAGEEEWKTGTRQLADGEKQLKQGKEDLDNNRKKAKQQFAAAHQQIETAKAELEPARQSLQEQEGGVISHFASLWPTSEWEALKDGAKSLYIQVLNQQMAEDALWDNLSPQWHAFLSKFPLELMQQPEMNQIFQGLPQLAIGIGKVNASIQQVTEQENTLNQQEISTYEQLEHGLATITEQEKVLAAAKDELMAGRAKLDESQAQLESGKEELRKQEEEAKKAFGEAWQKLKDARSELEEGEGKLTEGKTELEEKRQEYEEEKKDAEKELEDAREELADLDMTKWYIQDRTSLDSYSGLKSDTDSIEAVGTAFPILFFVVAVLISLTTITRMIEEDRGLIGIYKALGMHDKAIYGKYIFYAFAACILGGILGDLSGFILFPKFIWLIFSQMYSLPEFYLSFDILYGIGGVILFMAGIIGATAIVCRSELKHLPSALMRPKAPKAGTRVVLERIPFFWNRLKFLNKVTVRNLFRYKKRMFMTLIGIMGCTALILCGFAIRDSVVELMPRQYQHIYQYDLMTVFEAKESPAIQEQLKKDAHIKDFTSIMTENIKMKSPSGREESVQLMVVPDVKEFQKYIRLEDKRGREITLMDDSVVLTRNATDILDVKAGDEILLQNVDLDEAKVKLTDITENYLGNCVYVTKTFYEKQMGSCKTNGLLAHFVEKYKNQEEYASELAKQENIYSAVATKALREDFEENFTIVNAVVYLITVMAAGLAFVVLFTLATTNISERQRELSTIKVLGFYDPEVHKYVNKETVILTMLGILLGLPVGRGLAECLTIVLKMPSIYFAVTVKPFSYLITAVIAFCFALIVELFTNRILDHIDMVEALKSVE